MKQPTLREVKELVKRNNADGAFYLVIYNGIGKPEVSRFRSITKAQAERLLLEWVLTGSNQASPRSGR